MITKRFYLLITVCLLLSTLAACTRPAGKAPAVSATIMYTQAVQTLAAKLTVTPGAPAQQPTASSTLIPTQPVVEKPTHTTESHTETPKPGATKTAAATPAVTLDASDPLAGLGNPDWHEGFDGTGAWYVFEDEFVRFQAVKNKLEMTAFQANNRNGWALAPQLASNKYYIEMTATFGDACKGADHYGLMLSPVSSADRGYLLGISCEGKYVLWKWDGTRMTALTNWKASKAIQSGAGKSNRIGIKVEGNKLSLYANGTFLSEVTDVAYEKLYFGLFIGAAETAEFVVHVNSLNYWSLP